MPKYSYTINYPKGAPIIPLKPSKEKMAKKRQEKREAAAYRKHVKSLERMAERNKKAKKKRHIKSWGKDIKKVKREFHRLRLI